MSPRTGRPTNDPKTYHVSYRLSKEYVEKINKCSEVLGITGSDVIRAGIDKVYAEMQKGSDTSKKSKKK